MSGCYLFSEESYLVSVVAKDAESDTINAFNSPYAFSVASYPVATINSVAVTEGATLSFTVTIDQAWGEDVTLKWKSIPFRTTIEMDYTYSEGFVTILAGDTTNTASVAIATIDDSQAELEELVLVSLTNPFNAKLNQNSIGFGTINDNDAGANAVKMQGGNNHSCILTSEGKMKCFGDKTYGRLGEVAPSLGWAAGDMGDNLPEVDLGTGIDASLVAVTDNSTCTVLTDGTVKCFGRSSGNQLGYSWSYDNVGDHPGEMGDNITAISLGAPIIEIVGGDHHYCTRLNTNEVRCWGDNNYGQLGIGVDTDQYISGTTVVDLGIGRTAQKISLGAQHTCALLDNSEVKCWGYNRYGQLGLGDIDPRGDGPGEMGDNLPAIDVGNIDFLPDSNAEGISTASMKTGSTYTSKGWDFTNVWQINEGVDYPKLRDGGVSVTCTGTESLYDEFGLGTPGDPYKICTKEQLLDIGDNACNDVDSAGCDKDYVIINSLDLVGETINPIGSNTNRFVGTFSGNGKTLSNITLNEVNDTSLALFSYLGAGGIIEKLGLESVSVTNTGTGYTSALVGFSAGTIENSYAIGAVSGVNKSGGLIGYINSGVVSLNYTAVDVNGVSEFGGFAGASSGAPTLTSNLWDTTFSGQSEAYDGSSGTALIISDVTTTGYSTCILTTIGLVKCFGYNYHGQLGLEMNSSTNIGDGPNEMGNNLQSVMLGTGRTATKVVGGGNHTCAILDNSGLKCWGYDNYGQAGRGRTNYQLGDSVNEMGDYLWYAELGTGHTPIDMVLGSTSTCVKLDTSAYKCFGENYHGALGTEDRVNYGSDANQMGDYLPYLDLGTGVTITSLSRGVNNRHMCAVLNTGALKCWGYNRYGQLGLGDNHEGDEAGEMGASRPYLDFGTGMTVKDFSAGAAHSCAILNDNRLSCWGSGSSGRTGLETEYLYGGYPGDMGDNLATVRLGINDVPIKVTAGGGHTCILLDDFRVKCFGYNSMGQLGIGNTNGRGYNYSHMGDNLKAVDLGTNRYAIDISAGDYHTCAILDNYQVKCWGRSNYGQMGYGNTDSLGDESGELGDDLAFLDLGSGLSAIQIRAGYQDSCVHLDDLSVKCFGRNNNYFLGVGLSESTTIGDDPSEMGDALTAINFGTNSNVIDISYGSGSYSACAHLDTLGVKSVKCWGAGSYGRLGLGNSTSMGSTPTQISTNSPVSLGAGRTPLHVGMGSHSPCVILDNFDFKCWGNNSDGQLGLGDLLHRGDEANEMGDDLPVVDLDI